jgi:hypothetical protein
VKKEKELEWWNHPTEKTKSKVGYVQVGDTIFAIYSSEHGHDLVEWNLTTESFKFIERKVSLATAMTKMADLSKTTNDDLR